MRNSLNPFYHMESILLKNKKKSRSADIDMRLNPFYHMESILF